MHELGNWLATTRVSTIIVDSGWIWPLAEILHFVGLTVLLGVAGAFDLRLLGFFKGLRIDALHRLLPWAGLGFALNVATGLTFLVGTPLQYVDNPAFRYKMLFVAIAGLNALVFEFGFGKRTLAVDADGTAPFAARAIAATSLVSWLLVLYCGRILAFVEGGAF